MHETDNQTVAVVPPVIFALQSQVMCYANICSAYYIRDTSSCEARHAPPLDALLMHFQIIAHLSSLTEAVAVKVAKMVAIVFMVC